LADSFSDDSFSDDSVLDDSFFDDSFRVLRFSSIPYCRTFSRT